MKYCGKVVKSFIKTPQIVLPYLLLLVVSNIYLYKVFKAFWDEFKTAGAMSADSIYFYGDIRYICIVFLSAGFLFHLRRQKKLIL